MIRLIFLPLLLVGCSTPKKQNSPVLEYSSVQSQGIILDVREEKEVEAGTVAGSVWVPLSDAKNDPDKVRDIVAKIANDKEVFVYCRSGRRSQEFIDILGSKFETTNLGGYDDLIKRGFPKGYYIDYSSFK